MAIELAKSLVSDLPRALIEIHRFLHTLAGCPKDLLPRSSEDAKQMALSCSLGIWYTENEPKLKIPQGGAKFVRDVARSLVECNVIEDDVVLEMVAVIQGAATWQLDSGRRAAVFCGLNLITGLGEWNAIRYNHLGPRCQQVIEHIVISCLMENIGMKKQAQLRDTQIKKMIFAEGGSWFETRPDFYFGPCRRLLAVLIKHSTRNIALVGIQMLSKVLLKDNSERSVIVDNAFMWDIQEDLSKHVLKPARGKKVDNVVKEAILDFVKTRYPTTNHALDDNLKAKEWRKFARQILAIGQAV